MQYNISKLNEKPARAQAILYSPIHALQKLIPFAGPKGKPNFPLQRRTCPNVMVLKYGAKSKNLNKLNNAEDSVSREIDIN